MRWIVLLRGVNVGGHRKTPMAELRQCLTKAGAEHVATYIQSGNLIFDHPQDDPTWIEDWVTTRIDTAFGHRPPALAFTAPALQDIYDANPFPDPNTPKFMHFHLFRDAPNPDAMSRLTSSLAPDEEMTLGRRCLYHWPPQGFGKSNAAQKVPAALGITTTARNLPSLTKILDLA